MGLRFGESFEAAGMPPDVSTELPTRNMSQKISGNIGFRV